MAFGNGNFGALVWGDENLFITVNRADFWDHRGGELLLEGPDFQKLQAAYDPADPSKLESIFLREERPSDVLHSMRLPVGRFEFTFHSGWKLKEAALEMERGCVQVSVTSHDGNESTLTLVLHPSRPFMWIDDPDDVLNNVVPHPSWEWVCECLSQYSFLPPQLLQNGSTRGWVQTCPDDPALVALCRRVRHGFIIALALDAERPAREMADEEIARGEKDGLRVLLEECEVSQCGAE